MKLNNHLLYIDITQFCGVGCAFCMYADKHNKTHLYLSEKAKKNLDTLVNDPCIKRISISGEGEPLNNISVLYDILNLSKGGKKFEFITSGYLRYNKLLNVFKKIDEIVTRNGDTCNIRLSSDSHHIKQIKNLPHGKSIYDFSNNKFKNLDLSFRSIDPDKEFTREYLLNQALTFGYDAKIIINNELEDTIYINDKEYRIDYKNLVFPDGFYDKYLNMWEYIAQIESKHEKIFTFGSLDKGNNGLDVTIKPNGDLFLYGIDNIVIANIHNDSVNFNKIENALLENDLMRDLYTVPFKDVIYNLGDKDYIDEIIGKVNNPYWLLKEINIG